MSITKTYKTHKVEVFTSVQRRRRFSAGGKMGIVNEIREVGAPISSIFRRYGIAFSQLYRRRRAMKDGALAGVGSQEDLVAKTLRADTPTRTLAGYKPDEVEVL